MGILFRIIESANFMLGAIFTGITIAALVYYVIKYARARIKEDGYSQGIYLSVIYALEFLFFAWLFWGLPNLLQKNIAWPEFTHGFRWVEILITGLLIFRSRKHAEMRGVYSFLGHYVLLLFSWIISGWVGVIVIAFPILGIYYFVMMHVAFAVIPTSNPKDKKEKQNRFNAFFAYIWGLQLPFWKASSNVAIDVEKRIDGTPSFDSFSGLVWTHAHQVVGLAEGPNFSVKGPGLIFISKKQQPFDVIDLRDQSRPSVIKAISRDGISFEANVTVSFCVDREAWTNDQHRELRRTNPILRDGKELDRNLHGTFPYSQARVKAVLSYRSRKTTIHGEATERWDDHVLGLAEQAAREVLSERSIEELWKARENENSSSSEEIANEMKGLIGNSLRSNGIHLINAKATNFSFKEGSINEKEKDEISEQQLATWSVEWEKQRAIALANGQAESERFQQEARAYAHSVLLTAIAEGLQQARSIHPNLPRYVIAMRYIGALEEMIEHQPETNEKENLDARANIRHVKAHFLSHSHKE